MNTFYDIKNKKEILLQTIRISISQKRNKHLIFIALHDLARYMLKHAAQLP